MSLKSLHVENYQAYQLAYLRQIRSYYNRKGFIHLGPGFAWPGPGVDDRQRKLA